MTCFTSRCTQILVFSCFLCFFAAVESSVNKIDTSELDSIWNNDLILGNAPNGKLKSISSMLDSFALEQKPVISKNIEKPKEVKTKNIIKNESVKPVTKVEKPLKEIVDIIVEKEINERTYFPENVKKLDDLPKPSYLERSKVLSLLSKDMSLDLFTNENLPPEYSFLESIVSINNKTLEMSGLDLLQGFVSDIDSICRLSVKWFENYPKFVKVLRKVDSRISGHYIPESKENHSNSGQKTRLSRRFTNDWINFLNLLKTIEIDSKTYRQNRRMLRKYKEINHKDLKQYRRNIYNELQLYNNLLLSILLKLSFYIQYIVYFPNTGKLFGGNEDYSYNSQFKKKYQKQLSDENDELIKLNRIDIYVNRIPSDILREVRTSISSCSGVVKILHGYGIHLDSTPNDIISLYLQYKRITRILLNIYNSETSHLFEKHSSNNNLSSINFKSNYDNYGKRSKHIFDQNFVPNKIGFKPFQIQEEKQKFQEKRKPQKSKHIENFSNVNKDPTELKFNYLSKESVEKFVNENERNLFQLINQDLTTNKFNKETGLSISKKRPSGASGLIIFSQKYNVESEYDCTAKVLHNGNVEINFNKNILSGFSGKISTWFKNNYLKHFYNNKKNNLIPLQFKLMIACPYAISNHCMQNNCGGLNDVFMLIYLVGRLKGYYDDWKIVTEFNSITADTNMQWKIVSILIPDIQSHLGKMCPVQSNSLKSQVLKTSRQVVFKSPVQFENLSEEFKYENANIKESIIRNCLNYVQEETVIEFLTKDGGDDGVAICRNNHLYIS
ncbi:putative signal peptide-containing protein [Cryptosporidium hominis]